MRKKPLWSESGPVPDLGKLSHGWRTCRKSSRVATRRALCLRRLWLGLCLFSALLPSFFLIHSLLYVRVHRE